MSVDLAETLVEVRALMRAAVDPWWVIGSAAVVLHGGQTTVADVDLTMSMRDAEALLAKVGLPAAPGVPNARFRSAIFARYTRAALPIEIMAGFTLREGDAWLPVRFATREIVGGVPAPSRADLIAMLRRFGRPKDLRRAAALDAIS